QLSGGSMPENANPPPEPSMEETIASISRIITEDKKPNEAERAVATQRDDILELTEAVDEDGSVRRLTPLASNPSAASAGSSPPVDAPMVDPDKLVEAGAPGAEAGGNVRPEIGRERILSSATSGAAAAAFSQLGPLPPESRTEGELPPPRAHPPPQPLPPPFLPPP